MMSILVVGGALAFASRVHADPPGFSVADVRGRYAFSFRGTVGNVPVVSEGVFFGNGDGTISSGERWVDAGGVQLLHQTFTCSIPTNKFTPNGMGEVSCTISGDPNPIPVETYKFVLEERGDGVRFISADPGIVVLGSGFRGPPRRE